MIPQTLDSHTELRDLLKDKFSPLYERNDNAHREPHFEMVFLEGKRIAKLKGMEINEELLLVASYVHDMFSWMNRVQHHLLSKLWVEGSKDSILERFTKQERIDLAEACLKHRGSIVNEFDSEFAELFNAADYEGFDPRRYMLRAISCRREDYNPFYLGGSRLPAAVIIENQYDAEMEDSLLHLEDKFGENGYANYPKLVLEIFGTPNGEFVEYIEKMRDLRSSLGYWII